MCKFYWNGGGPERVPILFSRAGCVLGLCVGGGGRYEPALAHLAAQLASRVRALALSDAAAAYAGAKERVRAAAAAAQPWRVELPDLRAVVALHEADW